MSGPKTYRYKLTTEQQRIELQKTISVEIIKNKSRLIADVENIFSDDSLISNLKRG